MNYQTDNQAFLIYCQEEVYGVLNKNPKELLDYARFYVFLHFVLEIELSVLFRQLRLMHVFLKTPHVSLTLEEIDERKIVEKIDLLNLFTKAQDLNRLKGWYCNFAEKRNKITHGYWIGNSSYGSSQTLDWFSDIEMQNQLDNYHKMIHLIQKIIEKLPALTEHGKKRDERIIA